MGYRGSISYVVAILLCKSTSIHRHAFVLPIVHTSSTDNNIIIQYKHSLASVCYSSGSCGQDQKDDKLNINNTNNNNNNTQPDEEEKDTIRVRIWKALVSSNNKEISLTQLCKLIGVRNKGDVRSHLIHVERQAKTIQNKSNEWLVRRGLLPVDIDTDDSQDGGGSIKVGSGGAKKLKIKRRKGAKNEEFTRLII